MFAYFWCMLLLIFGLLPIILFLSALFECFLLDDLISRSYLVLMDSWRLCLNSLNSVLFLNIVGSY